MDTGYFLSDCVRGTGTSVLRDWTFRCNKSHEDEDDNEYDDDGDDKEVNCTITSFAPMR